MVDPFLQMAIDGHKKEIAHRKKVGQDYTLVQDMLDELEKGVVYGEIVRDAEKKGLI
ncbi:MAG: hypothetical protein KAS32_11515 [Candidatus Peribacteraceae bacterium]|nr:hypothetical protein [Candidatus Peribacteraceae bacterium]